MAKRRRLVDAQKLLREAAIVIAPFALVLRRWRSLGDRQRARLRRLAFADGRMSLRLHTLRSHAADAIG